ncbi:MAG: hypothetical protein ACE5LA_04700 [Dehalococcoidales bacterium]
MSRLIDKLNQIAKVAPQPMGFRAKQPVSTRQKILLIASLVQAGNVSKLADCIPSADAVLLPVAKLSARAKTVEKIARCMSDIPWGGWLGDISRKEIRPMVEAGCDFIVFPSSTALALSQDDEIGKILQVEASLSEGLLRAVNVLPIDAVLIAEEPEKERFLTWHRLMLFQRFADLLTKPLLVSAPLDVSADELQVLWKIGVDGVVVEVGIGQPVGRFQELRQIINKLTFPPRKRERVEALLPRVGEEAGKVTETEEEEE